VDVEGVERLVGDLLRLPPGAGLVGEDADHGVAGLVAVQHGGMPALAIEGDVVPIVTVIPAAPGWSAPPAGAGSPGAGVSPGPSAGLPCGVSGLRDGPCGRGWFPGAVPGSGLVPGGTPLPGVVRLNL
jgi:hypothetical protein